MHSSYFCIVFFNGLLIKKLNEMRQIGKLKLTQLDKVEMDARQQNALKGGIQYCVCGGCGCPYDKDLILSDADADKNENTDANFKSF